MDTTHDTTIDRRGIGAALLAFAAFVALGLGFYTYDQRQLAESGQDLAAGDLSRLRLHAFMGSDNARSSAADFQSADVTAVMGLSVLDLRNADIDPDGAVIKASVLMGQVQIRVPEDWTVITGGVSLMGHMDNRTKGPENDPKKRLRLKRLIMMGEITITH